VLLLFQQDCFYVVVLIHPKVKGKAVPVQAWRGPESSRLLRLPDFTNSAHEGGKVVNPSTGRLYPPGNIPANHFCYRLRRPHNHSEAGRIMSMKYFSDIIGNRTGDLPVCRIHPKNVSQITGHFSGN